jgi:hypothetical protein
MRCPSRVAAPASRRGNSTRPGPHGSTDVFTRVPQDWTERLRLWPANQTLVSASTCRSVGRQAAPEIGRRLVVRLRIRTTNIQLRQTCAGLELFRCRAEPSVIGDMTYVWNSRPAIIGWLLDRALQVPRACSLLIQRMSSDLRRNPHLHVVFLDDACSDQDAQCYGCRSDIYTIAQNACSPAP